MLEHCDKLVVVFCFVKKHLDLGAKVGFDGFHLSFQCVSSCHSTAVLLLEVFDLFSLLVNGVLEFVDVFSLLLAQLVDLALCMSNLAGEDCSLAHHALTIGIVRHDAAFSERLLLLFELLFQQLNLLTATFPLALLFAQLVNVDDFADFTLKESYGLFDEQFLLLVLVAHFGDSFLKLSDAFVGF